MVDIRVPESEHGAMVNIREPAVDGVGDSKVGDSNFTEDHAHAAPATSAAICMQVQASR